MKLTPLDIKKQEFKKGFRGYDSLEVDAFLEMIADEYEGLIRERNQLSDEVLKLRTQLKDYQQVEKTFKESLMKAQQTIDQSRENAYHEAELKIKDAEIKAEKILESTKIQLSGMKNELILIKAQKDSFAKRLKHLLESQLELIGVLEIDDIGFGKFEDTPVTPKPTANTKAPAKSTEIEFSAIDEDDAENFETKPSDKNKYSYSDQPIKTDSIGEQANEKLSVNDKRKIKLSDQFII